MVSDPASLFLTKHPFTQFHTVGTSIAAIIVLIVCAGPNRVSGKDAFTLYENNTGWANGELFLIVFEFI
jgi:hypothetical protein